MEVLNITEESPPYRTTLSARRHIARRHIETGEALIGGGTW